MKAKSEGLDGGWCESSQEVTGDDGAFTVSSSEQKSMVSVKCTRNFEELMATKCKSLNFYINYTLKSCYFRYII